MAGRAVGDDARHEEHLRRPGASPRGLSPGQAERILANPFYRNISAALSGTQEYMAGEKLYELSEDPRFDLVVVDIPPTRNALDFLDAPGRAHPLPRPPPLPGAHRPHPPWPAGRQLRRPGVPSHAISKVVGGDVVSDAVAYFQAFEGMEAGFRVSGRRGRPAAPRTGDRLPARCAAPRRDAIREAEFFLGSPRAARHHSRPGWR